MNQKTVTA